MEQLNPYLEINTTRLSPVEAEVEIVLVTNRPEKDLEFTGRLVGPRCRFSSTVEVSYSFQPPARARHSVCLPEGYRLFRRRVIIPEPSLWELTAPFVYTGFARLAQQGVEIERWPIRCGLRSFRLRSDGLSLNGHLLKLNGVTRREISEAELLELPKWGVNTIMAPVSSSDLFDQADIFGSLVVGEISADVASLDQGVRVRSHPSACLFLVSEEVLKVPWLSEHLLMVISPPIEVAFLEPCLGLRLDRMPEQPLPDWVSFVACSEELLPELAEINLPKLLLCQGDIPETLPDKFGPLLGAISLTR